MRKHLILGAVLMLPVLLGLTIGVQGAKWSSGLSTDNVKADNWSVSAEIRRAADLKMYGKSVEEFYETDVKPFEATFKEMGANNALARELSWSVVVESRNAGINPWFTVAVIKTENPWLVRDTVSYAGAVGIMQVMPFHAGKWGCGEDLTDVRTNICSGTKILRSYLENAWGPEFAAANRRALLAYNGCVNTQGCESYADKVWSRTGFGHDHELVWNFNN